MSRDLTSVGGREGYERRYRLLVQAVEGITVVDAVDFILSAMFDIATASVAPQGTNKQKHMADSLKRLFATRSEAMHEVTIELLGRGAKHQAKETVDSLLTVLGVKVSDK